MFVIGADLHRCPMMVPQFSFLQVSMFIVSCIVFPTALNAKLAFVRPNSSMSCASSSQQPCLTFNEYAQQFDQHFVDDTTFLFLPGTHQLDFQLDLEGLSNIAFAPLDIQNHTVQLLLSPPFNITFTNCTNIEISRLVFILSGKRINVFVPYYGPFEILPQLAFQNATGHLSKLTLTGSGTGTFVACFSSHVQISNLVANGIKAQTLYANNSAINFHGQSTFYSNDISMLAENLYILELVNCYCNFTGNIQFINNTRALASFCESHTVIAGNLSFVNNTINSTYVLRNAMNFRGGTVVISGNISFANNTAPEGGSLIRLHYRATCHIDGNVSFIHNNARLNLSTFSYIQAYYGTAISIDNPTLVIRGAATFVLNRAIGSVYSTFGIYGGAIHVDDQSRMIFEESSVVLFIENSVFNWIILYRWGSINFEKF